jgi:cytochrome c oxidase subunit 2
VRTIVRVLEGIQSALNPQGPDAAAIAEISWVLFVGGAAIFIVVMALAAYAIFARRDRAARLSSSALIVGGGVVFPIVTLTVLLAYSLVRAAALGSDEEPSLRIEVIGEQWWWRVHYLHPDGGRDFATANEIHLPVGQRIELQLKSADVIHSFWVPAVAGKLDMIPGRTNRLRFVADRTGRFRGQCAEYCGGPHAFMALFVVAEAPEDYARWAQAQRRVAPASADDSLRNGAALFAAQCAACHTVRGTPAAGTRGPDLTHVGSRLAIGAGVLPMNAGTLAGWIASSQHLKPGNLMPSFSMFTGDELRALASYLESLK